MAEAGSPTGGGSGTGGSSVTAADDTAETAENYRRFAELEAAGRSTVYEALALSVAGDRAVLDFLGSLPPPKRQPNLLFAAARALLGEPAGPRTLHDLVVGRTEPLRGLMLARRTQTNEAGRCAVFLPALATLSGPLSLLEVGAAAGLTLLPDLYSYDYDGHRVAGLDPDAPTLRCRPLGPVPFPQRVPEIVWRAGIDLNPLDVTNDDDVAWLSCLVWPGEADREERLRAAVATARRAPPVVHGGDLLDDLDRVAAAAPKDMTLVVYHSAVLAYVDDDKRRAFARAVSRLGAVWLSNEGDAVLRSIGVDGGDPASFVLVRDGRDVLARSDPHASWVEWRALSG